MRSVALNEAPVVLGIIVRNLRWASLWTDIRGALITSRINHGEVLVMPWSSPTVVVDSLTLELAEDELRQAAAKVTGSTQGYKDMRWSDAQDVRDQIVEVAERLRKMRDGAQR